MNLTSFEYFTAVAKELSFTRAAQQLHTSQQTLSAHIAALEKELGCTLFVRTVPLQLTYGGQRFLHYARRIQEDVSQLRAEFRHMDQKDTGVLRIGGPATRSLVIMPQIAEVFRQYFPRIELRMVICPDCEIADKLRGGAIDIGIAHFGADAFHLQTVDFCREDIVFAATKSLLSRQLGSDADRLLAEVPASGSLCALGVFPFVAQGKSDCADAVITQLYHADKYEPWITARTENTDSMVRLCLRDVGGCLCPENLLKTLLTQRQLEQIAIVPLGASASYSVSVGWLQDPPAWSLTANKQIINAFVEIATTALFRNTN